MKQPVRIAAATVSAAASPAPRLGLRLGDRSGSGAMSPFLGEVPR